MKTTRTDSAVNRRTALAGLGAGSLGLALLANREPALADHMSRTGQEAAAASSAEHPAVGMWLLMNPTSPPTPSIVMLTPNGFAMSSGTVNHAEPADASANYPDADKLALLSAAKSNVVFSSLSMGTWEAIGSHKLHVTLTSILTDAAGAFTGTTTVDTYPVLDEKGNSLTYDTAMTSTTVRDASLQEVLAVAGVATTTEPQVAWRMGSGRSAFPEPKSSSRSDSMQQLGGLGPH
jgi:hypothetical protein